MGRRRGQSLVSAAFAAMLGTLLLAGPAAADVTPTPLSPTPSSGSATKPKGPAVPLTFGIKPKDFGGQARPAFRFQIAPGATTNDAVSLYNLSKVPLDLRLYATDGYTTPQGSFAALEAAKKPSDTGTWIRLLIPANSVLRVPPRSKVDVPFELTVPQGASPGDHPGAIVVSLRSKADNGGGTLLNVDSRVLAPLNVRVTGEVKPALAIEGLSASYASTINPFRAGAATVQFTVRNTGNIAQGGTVSVALDGLVGPGVDPVVSNLPVLTPGSAVDIEVPFSEVWPEIHYSADVSVTPLAEAGDPVGEPQKAQTSFWALPLALLGLILGIAIVVAVVVARRRNRPTGGRHAATPASDSSELAGVSS